MKHRGLYANFPFPSWEKARMKEQYHCRALSAPSSPDKREGVGSDPPYSRARPLRLARLMLLVLLFAVPARAQTLEQIVSEAKKEGEVTLVASASTFGGKKGFAELEHLFVKR